MPPTGELILPGPDPDRLPRGANGLHLIILRVEATDDREAGSNLGTGIVTSGGVAGFMLPVLRYYVGGGPQGQRVVRLAPGSLRLVTPAAGEQFPVVPAARALSHERFALCPQDGEDQRRARPGSAVGAARPDNEGL